MHSRILIADDHELVRSALRSAVEAHAGWQVCGEASNGREAVQKATELQPDLIIMDLVMPEMDGMQASRLISADYPKIPILMHTIDGTATLAQEARKYGVRSVVRKGGAARELISAMETLLDGRDGGGHGRLGEA